LASVPSAVVDTLGRALPDNVAYCKSWRQQTGTGDFQTLRQWLDYAATPDGPQASISIYLDVDDLERLGDQIAGVVLDLAAAATPLFEYCYLGQVEEPPPVERPRTESLQGKPWAGCARCGHPWQLHSNGRTPCLAVGCRRGPDGAPCPGFVADAGLAAPAVLLTLDADALQKLAAAAPYELELDEQVYRAVIAAICSGKHIILTGPPGTAKTTLAKVICELAYKAERCSGYTLTTATADWTTYDTIGGLRPEGPDGSLEFREGLFLEAIQTGRWLIIDELNRSNFDRAFGQLFTVLSGQSVALPYETPDGRRIVLDCDDSSGQFSTTGYARIQIPESWRIVATMNVFDKSLLFEMSFALMRRFAFIEVPSPEDPVFAELWSRKLRGMPQEQAERIEQVLTGLLGLTEIKDIGPAVFIDMAKFSREYFTHSPLPSRRELAFQLFYSYLLPQFEGITKPEGQKLYTKVLRLAGEPYRDKLRTTLTEVLGITLDSRQASSEDEADEELEADWEQGSLLLPGEE
jgi:MoxR-like ATPase